MLYQYTIFKVTNDAKRVNINEANNCASSIIALFLSGI